MSELRPCPFCGAPGRTEQGRLGDGTGPLAWSVGCSHAGCIAWVLLDIYIYPSEAMSASRWNWRAEAMKEGA